VENAAVRAACAAAQVGSASGRGVPARRHDLIITLLIRLDRKSSAILALLDPEIRRRVEERADEILATRFRAP
jgi:hypothetical protein